MGLLWGRGTGQQSEKNGGGGGKHSLALWSGLLAEVMACGSIVLFLGYGSSLPINSGLLHKFISLRSCFSYQACGWLVGSCHLRFYLCLSWFWPPRLYSPSYFGWSSGLGGNCVESLGQSQFRGKMLMGAKHQLADLDAGRLHSPVFANVVFLPQASIR